MLALFLAPAAITADEIVVPISIEAAPPAIMMDIGGELSSLLSQLNRMRTTPRPTRSTNPCTEDARHLHCSDAACLRRAADDLTPACAAFLLNAPEPSPAPEAVAAVSRTRAPPARAPSADDAAPTGFFTVFSSTETGTRRVSGRGALEAMMRAEMAPPLMPQAMAELLPPEMRALLGGAFGMPPMMAGMSHGMSHHAMPPHGIIEIAPGIALSLDDDEEEEARPRPVPCQAELAALHCERASAQQCLLSHLPQLSHTCVCHLHHMLGERFDAAVASHAPVPPRGATERRSRDEADDVIVVVDPNTHHHDHAGHHGVHELEPPPAHPLHRLSCLLFFAALLLLTTMATKACLAVLCGGRGAARAHIVMVPPESGATITQTKAKAMAPLTVG